jgi:hypothetical protein
MLTHILVVALVVQAPGRRDPDEIAADPARAVIDPTYVPPPSKVCNESDAQFQSRRFRTASIVGAPGFAALAAGGLTLWLARERMTVPRSGPNCMIGKPCGMTCISQEDQCHLTSGSSLGPLTRPGLIATIVLFSVGVALMVAGGVTYRKMERRRFSCTASGCSFALRF